MAFHEVRFPDNISYGSKGGPGFKTNIVVLDSGAESRVARWNNPRRRYNVAYGIQSHEDLYDLQQFYINRQGPANGFRYKDFFDYTTATDGKSDPSSTDVVFGAWDDADEQFQLFKRYTSGSQTVVRNLTKPVANTVVIRSNGVDLTEGVDFTVDTTTGMVTFDTGSIPAEGDIVTFGCEFDVPCRFGKEVDDLLQFSYDDFSSGSANDIPVVEVYDSPNCPNDFNYGGSSYMDLTANVQISLASGRALSFAPQSTGIKVYLPLTSTLVMGGPYFFFMNHGSNAYSVYSNVQEGKTELFTVNPGDFFTVVLGEVSGTRTWFAG